MNLRERLRSEIARSDLNAKEIARRVGVSYSTFLSYIDARGVLPNAEAAVRIAQELGVSVEYLVTGKEEILDSVARNGEYRKLIGLLDRLGEDERREAVRAFQELAVLMRRRGGWVDEGGCATARE